MEALFWLSALFVFYVYFGYPLVLAAWVRLAGGRRAEEPDAAATGELPPGVSIVLAARNEASRLPGRIQNLLSLAYPADRRQIIVVSDGSTDATVDVLARFRQQIDLVVLPPSGKAAALNAGVARARHDILVFADARQTFASDALLALTAPFADAAVGGVTGELVLDCEATGARRTRPDRRDAERATGTVWQASWKGFERRRRAADRRSAPGSSIGDGVGAYWRYEKALRRMESAIGSTLGATGCIWALRRELWQPLPPGTILDDVLAPMRAVLAGYRVVFAGGALAFDRTAADSAAESRRKIRTLAGNFQILALEPRLLDPFANPVWLQFLSHKIGRLAVPYALLILLAASIVLAERHWFYAVALAAQSSFYLLGGYGAWLEMRSASRQPRAAAPVTPMPAAGVRREKQVANA